jgi:hypothetical protein
MTRIMKKREILWLTGLLLTLLWLVPPVAHRIRRQCPVRPDGVGEAQALPLWARRYGVSCNVCHTTIPALTKTGYLFRRAGFRLPNEYGQEAQYSGLKDFWAARVQEDFQVTSSRQAGATTSNSSGFVNQGTAVFPISGAFGRWWAARGELTIMPNSPIEVEQAYAVAAYPRGDWIFTARAGIMHPFWGYGASDESLSNFDPLIWSETANNAGFDSVVTLMGQSQEGAEVSAGYKDTTLSLAVWNGYNTASGAANQGDDDNRRDYRLFFNQIFGDAAAFSAEYLRGNSNWGALGAVPSGTVPVTWRNYYQRYAFYGNYKVLGDALDVLGGYAGGRDHFHDPTTDTPGTFNSGGWFGEVRSKLHEHFTASVRYDAFRPTTRVSSNDERAITVTGVVPFENIRFMVDYQNKQTKFPTTSAQTDQTTQLECMLIF